MKSKEMTVYTWDFNTTASDQNGNHTWKRIDTLANATVSGGKLIVTNTGYFVDVSDIPFNRKWKMTFYCKDDATSNTTPTYFLSVGPVYGGTDIGGFIIHRPPGSESARLDDAPSVTDLRRQVTSRQIYGLTWYPPFELTYDPVNDVRRLSLYQEGVRISDTPLGDQRDPDTYYNYLYIGSLLDSSATPCTFDSITLDNDWNGSTMGISSYSGGHLYHRIRLLGSCSLLECGLDTTQSATTDDGVSIRTNTLTMVDGTADVLARIYDKLYVFECAFTAGSSGWSTIQYTETAATDPQQLRIGAKSTATLPSWCELQYSVDGITWFMEDRFQILDTHFQVSGSRADCIATYQRNAVTQKWGFVRNFSTGGGGGGSFSNTKSFNLGVLNGGSGNPVTPKYGQFTNLALGTAFSVSIWLKIDSSILDTAIVFRYWDGTITTATNYVAFRLRNLSSQIYPHILSSNGVNQNVSSCLMTAGVWQHLVITWNTTTGVIAYLNGTAYSITTSASKPSINQTTNWITIGFGEGDRAVSGLMDEVALFNSVLTSSEVTTIYNSGTPMNLSNNSGNYVSSANLKSYTRFEASDGANSVSGAPTMTFPNGSAFSTDKP
jgi:hypothetical protein